MVFIKVILRYTLKVANKFMAPQIISVKELRQKFPEVRKRLEKGQSFIIVHRSKELADLVPRVSRLFGRKKTGLKMADLAGSLHISKNIGKKLTADYINEISEEMYEE